MATEVKVPTLGESVTEATVGQWLKKPGEAVKADEPIVSLETDKVAVDVPSPVAGVMGDLVAKEGDTVEVGALLAYVNEGGAAAAAPAAAAPAPEQKAAAVNPAGEQLYKTACFACHATGVANAPKFGDKAAWEPYIKTGMDAMVKVAMQGKPPMPPKGGAANASEDDIRAAVQYMVDAAK